MIKSFKTGRLASFALLMGATAISVAACGGSSDATTSSSGSSSASSAPTTQLALVAYSTPKKAYDALTAAFEKTTAGKGVGFSESFGASGSQSRAVDTGQPADIVAFSTTPDMTRLVKDKLVAPTWDANAEKGMSSDSVVVFVVRKGNPKHITGWDDLIKPGVDVITPNPSTSGSARWNILAGYGAELKEGKTPAQALAYVRTLLTKNVSVQDSAASAALQTFTGGKGDVLLDYESDAIAAEKAGDAIQYIIPKQTILIQLPIAVLENSPNKYPADLFIQYLKEEPAQVLFGQKGFRPVNPAAAKQFKFPVRPGEITINDPVLGGYTAVENRWFATGALMDQIESAVGGPTS